MITIYAGSFDPFTNGHLEVVQQAARVFDRVIVLVGDNPEKRHWFAAEKRKRIIQESVGALAEADILPASDTTVEYAYRRGACLVRGLGDFTDYPAEKTLHGVNCRLRPEVDTVFLMTRGAQDQMRSSSVRETVKYRFGWRSIRDAVPRPTFNAVAMARFEALGASCARMIQSVDLTRYSGRPYHNLEHLLYMIDTARLWNGDERMGALSGVAADAHEALSVAILYHDLFVDSDPDVGRDADVEKSAARLRSDAGMLGDLDLAGIEALVLATDHRRFLFAPGAEMSPAQKLMASLDFAVLGESRYEYGRYAKAIREEYAPKYGYLSDAFRTGRGAFLEKLLHRLGMGGIISPDYDARMADNARWELEELALGR